MSMTELVLFAYWRVRTGLARAVRDERGEGVISAAIAVLIMAALGAAMWVGMQKLWNDTSSRTSAHVAEIGGK